MKVFLRVIIIVLPYIAQAQNWELFNSYDHYDFKQNSAPLINSVCFADSFEVSGSDTLYFVNRIVERNNLNNQSSADTAQLNRSQFLQREIWKKANGWYVFFNPGSLTININAGLAEQWLYDTVRNITITVIKTDTATEFGVLDSIKYFALSDSSDTIIISRTFGILKFPTDTADRLQPYTGSFLLQGIETRNVGERPVNFYDIYNFNVGDIFAYEMVYYQPGGWAGDAFEFTILSKSITNDSISYTASEVGQSYTLNPVTGPPSEWTDTVTLTFRDSTTHLANTYPGQFLDYIIGYYYPDPSDGYSIGGYTFSSYVIDTTAYSGSAWGPQSVTYGVPCKKAGVNNSIGAYALIQNNRMLGGTKYYCVICEGLGLVHYGIWGFENEDYLELTGYEKNGVIYGNVEWNGISEISPTPLLRVYPSVVKDILLVSLKNATEATYYFNLFDLTGKQLMSQRIAVGNTSILCQNLAPALYVWRVYDGDKNILASGKIVKH